MFDNLMELIHIDLQDYPHRADTFSRVTVWTESRDILEPKHISRANDDDFLAHELLLLLVVALVCC